MFAKFLLIALVAFGSCQATTEIQEKGIIVDHIIKGLLEEAAKGIAKLEALLHQIVNGAIDTVENILEDIRHGADKVIDETSAIIHADIEKLIHTIEILKQQAEELGLGLSECFAAEIARIRILERQIIEDLVRCVTSKKEEARAIVVDTLLEVKGVWDVFAHLKKNLANCKHNHKCLIEVIADIADKTLKLPPFVLGQVIKAKKFIATAPAQVAACSANAISRIPGRV